MPEFRSDEWESVEKSRRIELTERHMVDLWVASKETVGVFGVRGKASTLLKSGKEFRFRGQVKGFEALEVIGTGPFGLKCRASELQVGEYNSGIKAPVVDVPEPSNLLLRMRQIARAHHEATRIPVLDQDEFPSFGRYEADDDEELMFEEEAFEKRQEDARKAKAEAAAKARKEAEAKAGEAHAPAAAPERPVDGPDAGAGSSHPPSATAAE